MLYSMSMYTKQKTTLKGITLIELVVTIAVIGTIIAIALPKINTMIKNNALVTNANAFVALLNLARNEAITREANVIFCASGDSTRAAPVCDSNNWESGWLLFSDVGSTANSFDNNDIIIKRAPSATVGNTIRTTFATVGKLTFLKNGLVSSIGTISFCDDRGLTQSRALAVSRVGRVSSLGIGSATECP